MFVGTKNVSGRNCCEKQNTQLMPVNIFRNSVGFEVIKSERMRQNRFTVLKFINLFVLCTSPVFNDSGGRRKARGCTRNGTLCLRLKCGVVAYAKS
jgi:hypothetical protein